MQKSLKKWIAVLLCAAVIAGLITFDLIADARSSEKTYIAMGTVVKSKITGKDAADAEAAVKETIDGIESACLSWRIEGSDIARINADAGTFISVSKDTTQWIARCIDISEKSNGAFDPSIGRLTQLWDFDNEAHTVPAEQDIAAALETVDYTSIFFNDIAVKIADGQQLDLGAVGKGIACDSARETLEKFRVKSAVLSVGGSILLYGKQATVGIADPENDQAHIATLRLKDQCVSTSGDYERFFLKDGKRYHHILDPATGYPTDNNLRSVTVVTDAGLDSDALSTACFVMGYPSSLGLLRQCDAEAVYVFNDHTVVVTDGLRGSFTLTDSNYTEKTR